MMSTFKSGPSGSGGVGRWIRVQEHSSVAREGSGGESHPPVLLLHGFTGCAESWESEILSALCRDRRVLAVDLPGHGAGADTPDPTLCGLEAVVEGLCAILDERDIQAADWVGYSMGGRIALAAAVLNPVRVRRLVLESASPGIEDEGDRARRRCGDEDLAQAIEDRGIEWFVDYWMGLPLFDTQENLANAKLRRARDLRRRGTAEAYAAALMGLGTGNQPSYWGELQGVQLPTLLLTGERDQKYQEIAMQMAAALPQSDHRSITGVGHAPHFEAPILWLEAVREFLGR